MSAPEELAEKVKVTVAQVEAWIEEGLPVLRTGDGGVRITETASDDWARTGCGKEQSEQPPVRQEWLTIKQAARLTGLSYSHVRRAVLRVERTSRTARRGQHAVPLVVHHG